MNNDHTIKLYGNIVGFGGGVFNWGKTGIIHKEIITNNNKYNDHDKNNVMVIFSGAVHLRNYSNHWYVHILKFYKHK